MTGLEALPFLGETGHVISLVGGGGKTTLLYALARHYSAQGQRVLVSTTTHIQRPDANYAPDEAARDALWQDRKSTRLNSSHSSRSRMPSSA